MLKKAKAEQTQDGDAAGTARAPGPPGTGAGLAGGRRAASLDSDMVDADEPGSPRQGRGSTGGGWDAEAVDVSALRVPDGAHSALSTAHSMPLWPAGRRLPKLGSGALI